MSEPQRYAIHMDKDGAVVIHLDSVTGTAHLLRNFMKDGMMYWGWVQIEAAETFQAKIEACEREINRPGQPEGH